MKRSWQPSFNHSDVRILKDETVFQGYFRVKQLTLSHRRFDGNEMEITRELFQRGDAVCVLLYDPLRDKVVLVEQFRVGSLNGPSPWMLEVVAGVVEEGESSRDVAQRESVEEAGVVIGEPKRIIRYLPSGGGCDEYQCDDSINVQGRRGVGVGGEVDGIDYDSFEDARRHNDIRQAAVANARERER